MAVNLEYLEPSDERGLDGTDDWACSPSLPIPCPICLTLVLFGAIHSLRYPPFTLVSSPNTE